MPNLSNILIFFNMANIDLAYTASLDNGQWTMDYGQWTMDNGQWTMDNGQLDNGQ